MTDKGRLIDRVIQLQDRLDHLILTHRVEGWVNLDLTIDQLKSLIIIYSSGKISFKDLAQALGINRSNITGLADRLVQSGLVTRSRNPEDRRVQYLALTERGHSILDNIRKQLVSEKTQILDAMSTEELAALEKGLAAFVSSCENFKNSQK